MMMMMVNGGRGSALCHAEISRNDRGSQDRRRHVMTLVCQTPPHVGRRGKLACPRTAAPVVSQADHQRDRCAPPRGARREQLRPRVDGGRSRAGARRPHSPPTLAPPAAGLDWPKRLVRLSYVILDDVRTYMWRPTFTHLFDRKLPESHASEVSRSVGCSIVAALVYKK